MRLLLIAGILGAAIASAACTPLERTGAAVPKGGFVCARRNVGFFQLPAELARVQNCGGVAMCRGSLSNSETKEVAGILSSTPLIWGLGSTNTQFTPAQQDGFLADARARAVAARPGSKMIVSISFFTDIVVSSPGSSGYIGAVVDYADCGAVVTPR